MRLLALALITACVSIAWQLGREAEQRRMAARVARWWPTGIAR